jgi:uncharacterized lipoprotein YddW (UPF0748 family)
MVKDMTLRMSIKKQEMMNANLVAWIRKTRNAIREVEPNVLVGVGFFSPCAVQDDPLNRTIETHWAIEDAWKFEEAWKEQGSNADYIDVHVYASTQAIQAEEFVSFGIPLSHQKPILMGEFGACQVGLGCIA